MQSQVLPYLRGLRHAGVRIHLLTFEQVHPCNWPAGERSEHERELEEHGIAWHFLRYHKRPSLPATMYDIASGAIVAARLVRKHNIGLVHGRAHVASAMGALVKRLTHARLLFDIRGFNPEEYVDSGIWAPGGLKYRLAKWAEKSTLRAADGFVVLTKRAHEILFSGQGSVDLRGRPVEVIPCCADLRRFRGPDTQSRANVRAALGLADGPVLVYLGSLGSWYLTHELAQIIVAAQRQWIGAAAMVLTQSDGELIAGPLRELGADMNRVHVRSVRPTEVPYYLSAADVGVSMIRPAYSKQSSSPTKLAEYLANGLPVLCNSGVGDVDAVIQEDRVGVLLTKLNREAYAVALDEVGRLLSEPDLAARCRQSARSRFDLEEVGWTRYVRLYERVLGEPKQVVKSDLTMVGGSR